MPDAPVFADIQAALARIQPFVHRTPVMTSRSFNDVSGAQVWLKCENFQRMGSFKIRGATNFLLSLPPGERARGVVTFSSGNHAQAVALAARLNGVRAVIVMPTDAPLSKREATRAQGAEIVFYDRLTEDREAIGRRIAAETGAVVLPPYDHPWTIAGQGTAALELKDQIPPPDALIAPLGGGGLLSGCAIAARALWPQVRIFGAEPELANDTYLSLQSGRRVAIPPPATIADGLRATQPGEITFPILQQRVEEILLVSEQEIRSTVRFLLLRMKILVEPSGAVAAAAVLHRKLPPEISSTAVILSGGNVDPETLAQILRA
ncbi:MAG: threonine ammonia-lyase [Bryobacteraceae bacterium]